MDVKLRASRDAYERKALSALLIGEPGRGPDQRHAFALLGAWMAEAPDDGLPAYLIGRGLFGSEAWPDASGYLDKALARDLREPRVVLEALRLRIIAACAQQDDAAAREFMKTWRAHPDLQAARWQALERRLGGCVREH